MTRSELPEQLPEFVDVFIMAMVISLPIGFIGMYSLYKVLEYYDI